MNILEKVKWGFIGCGEVTEKKSGPAFSMIKNSEVVAVMSRSAEKAESYARRNHIPRWYTDAQLLIGDEDVNAVYIATPPSSHATFAIMAAVGEREKYSIREERSAIKNPLSGFFLPFCHNLVCLAILSCGWYILKRKGG